MATLNAADFVKQPFIGSSDKTRNQAVDPKLEAALAKVAKETGVTFIVTSGGQDAKGTPNARRTGSTRHDHGGAADVQAKNANGQLIDFTTPAGQQQWSRIVQLARAEGITGIGAGKGYMGTTTVHLGYGKPATWSSGKSGAPVEPWLKAAYEAGGRTPPLNIPVVASQLDIKRPATGPNSISKATQDALRAAGFNPGASDGIAGPKTTAAIKAFQAKNGLTTDGIVGPQTTAALQRAATSAKAGAPSPVPSAKGGAAPLNAPAPAARPSGTTAPKSAATDDGTADVQQFLKSKGYDVGTVDGINGPRTQAAVKAFQAANGLTPDGIVGPLTVAAMAGGGNAFTAAQPQAGVTNAFNAAQPQAGVTNAFNAPVGATVRSGSGPNATTTYTGPNGSVTAGGQAQSYIEQLPYMSPSAIKGIQQELAARGAYKGAIDGIAGPMTRAGLVQAYGSAATKAQPLTPGGLFDGLIQNEVVKQVMAQAPGIVGPKTAVATEKSVKPTNGYKPAGNQIVNKSGETYDQRRSRTIAEGKASQLDQFGMIR